MFGRADAQQSVAPGPAGSPQDVVARQVAAVNAHDAATVAKAHAANAVITALPAGTVLASGSAAIESLFTKTFTQSPNFMLTLDKQIVLKTMVVNHYAVSNGPGPELISIYDVRDGVIANEWVFFG